MGKCSLSKVIDNTFLRGASRAPNMSETCRNLPCSDLVRELCFSQRANARAGPLGARGFPFKLAN